MQKFQKDEKITDSSSVKIPEIADELTHRNNVESSVFMHPQHGDVETLAALIQAHTPKRRGVSIRVWQFITLLDSLFVLLAGLKLFQDASESTFFSNAVANDIVNIFTPLLILIMASSLFGWETKYRLVRAALATADTDFRWLNALFELLSWPDTSLYTVARLRLLRLLPGVESDNCHHLTLEAQQSLKRQLEHIRAIKDPELASVILNACSRINLMDIQSEVRVLSHSPLVRGSVRNAARSFLLSQANLIKNTVSVPDLRRATNDSSQSFQYSPLRVPSMRKPFFFLYSLCALSYGGTELLVKLYHVLGYGIGQITPRVIIGIAGWTALTVSPLVLKRLLLRTSQITQIRRIARSEDVSAIPYLLEALTLPDRYINYLVKSRLKVLLPDVSEQNRDLFQRVHHDKLHQLLRPGEVKKDPDLAVAILTAMRKIGDASDIQSVKRLAEMRPLNYNQNVVVETAAQTLLILRENMKTHEETDTLLRSTAPSEKTQLLRVLNTDASEMLLRPDENEERIQNMRTHLE